MAGRRSLAALIAEFERHGRSPAWVYYRGYRRQNWSYAQTLALAYQVATELTQRGIGRGERVLLWGEDSPHWAAVFWACALRGVVAVPVDRGATAAFVEEILRRTEARLLFTSSQAHHPLSVPAIAFEQLPALVAHHPARRPVREELSRSDPLEIVFTSGTTGEPRGVVITHGNVLANLEPLEAEIERYRRYERWVHPLRFLHLVPFSHVFGQLMGLWVPPLLGGVVVLPGTVKPGEILRILREERASVLVTVPRLLENLRERLESEWKATGQWEQRQKNLQAASGEHFLRRWWRFRDVHHRLGWKFWAIVSGGATLPAELERFWTLLGYAVIQGYGLTETASVVAVQHPFALAPGSIGRPLLERDVKLSESGEILVRGESVAAAYWRQAGVLEPVVGEEGWFHTGDVGERDEAGRLYFKGRLKNVIVTAEGMKVFPEDLEAALREQPEVREAVVIGLEQDGNAVPCAILLLRQGDDDVAAAVVARANQRLAGHQKIRRWYLWPETDFPRTPTGKPQLHQIAARARQALLGASAAAAAPQTTELAAWIARLTGRAPEQVRPEAALGRQLGLSSLERIELLAALEERYQVELDETALTETTTIAQLEQLLKTSAPSQRRYPYPRWALTPPVRWMRVAVYYLLVWPALRLLGYPRILGRQRLREVRGPTLIVSNHITSIDIGFLLAALPARLRHRVAVAMEGERLAAMRYPPPQQPWPLRVGWQLLYGLVAAWFNVFSLPQQAGFRESFRYAARAVDRGYSIVVFPEGGRTPDGRLQPFRPGIGLLVRELALPVIPLRIEGLFELKRARRWWARPGRIRVIVGAPLHFSPELPAEEIARQLEQVVATLAPPAR